MHDGEKPLCIIGVLFHEEWGFPLDNKYGTFPDRLRDLLTWEAETIMFEAQNAQDKGATWGDALDDAIRLAVERGWAK